MYHQQQHQQLITIMSQENNGVDDIEINEPPANTVVLTRLPTHSPFCKGYDKWGMLLGPAFIFGALGGMAIVVWLYGNSVTSAAMGIGATVGAFSGSGTVGLGFCGYELFKKRQSTRAISSQNQALIAPLLQEHQAVAIPAGCIVPTHV